MKNISIGDAELEIMKAVWKAKEPVTSLDIEKEVSDRGWKKTTISTFLTRLSKILAPLCMGVSSGGKRPIYQLSNALFLVKSFHQNYPTILFSREVQLDIKHSCSMD